MSRQRELKYKHLCETARLIEESRGAGNLDAVAALLEVLRASCALGDISGTVGTHELEALADYTPDAAEAIGIYRRAIRASLRE